MLISQTFHFLVDAWSLGRAGSLGSLGCSGGSGEKDSEFGSFVLGSFWAALAARGTWRAPGFKHFELKRDFSLPLEFNFNSSHVY